MTYILGIDPGGVPSGHKSRSGTGWSIWEYDAFTPPQPVAHGQVQGDHRVFAHWYKHILPGVLGFIPEEKVCESFALDGRTLYPDITPARCEGVLAALAPETAYQANTYKANMPDAKIKALGWWWPGEGHALDSGRHVWARLMELKHMPTLLAVGPMRPGGSAAAALERQRHLTAV